MVFQLEPTGSDRRRFAHTAQESNLVVQVCHSQSNTCIYNVQSSTKNDADTGVMWDFYDITSLINQLREANYTQLDMMSLNLSFRKEGEKYHISDLIFGHFDEEEEKELLSDYNLSGVNGPLLLFWAEEQLIDELASNPSNNRRSQRKRRSDDDDNIVPLAYNEDDSDNTDTGDYCQKHSFTVNYSDLGWENWIISPKSYEAGYCAGLCPEPLNASLIFATRHGAVKSFLRTFNEDMRYLPAAYCVPFVLRPMSVMFTYNGTVQQRKLRDSIVESCGCT